MLLKRVEFDMTSFKPYELCPCGSEVKFKFCCYQKARVDRDNSDLKDDMNLNRALGEFKEKWAKARESYCIAESDDCDKQIVKAHSIQENGVLNKIAEEGHLSTFSEEVDEEVFGGIKPRIIDIGIRNASIFKGFCSYHDRELFKSIERGSEFKGDDVQCLELALRACAYELYQKKSKIGVHQLTIQSHPRITLVPSFVIDYKDTVIDCKQNQEDFEELLKIKRDENFDNLVTRIYTVEKMLNFSVTSAFTVHKDINGDILNDIYVNGDGIYLPMLFVTVLPNENESFVILSCLSKDYPKYKILFEQLDNTTPKNRNKYFNYLIINHTMNVYFRPSYIKGLSKTEKESLLDSFTASVTNLHYLISDEETFSGFDLFA